MMVSRRFKPCNMNGCVLYLPFYAYGGNAQKIWDMSGQGNHGVISGAVPGSYPILAGSDLVTNGGMEIGNPPMGWSATDTPEIFESSGVQKYSGNSSVHINDSIPSYGGTQQKFNPSAQKTYKFSYRYYIVSGVLGVRATDVEVGYVYNVSHSTTGSWQYAEGFFNIGVANPNDYIWFFNNSASVGAEFYIDDVSIQEVTSYESLGWRFDGSTAYIDCGGASNLAPTEAITISTWVNPSSGRNDYATPISRGSGVGVDGYQLMLRTNGMLSIFIAGSSGWIYYDGTGTYPLADGKWTNVALTYDRAHLIGYINGAVDKSVANAEAITYVSGNTLICDNGYADRKFKGFVGESLLFTRALSAEEIKSYYELTRSRYGV